MLATSKYVKGPKEIQLFLSQVGIVNSIEQGNKHQKSLRPGQLLVSENVHYEMGWLEHKRWQQNHNLQKNHKYYKVNWLRKRT